MTEPYTRPAYAVSPPTRPASVVHPSWGVNVPVPVEEPLPAGATAARHAAPEDDEPEVQDHMRLGATGLVMVIAMFCVTLCVAIVSLLGDPRGGACLAGAVVLIGAVMAWVFRSRWR